MQDYLHMSPNFGKHKLIPILLLLPIASFFLIYFASERQTASNKVEAFATAQPIIKREVTINETSVPVEIVDTDRTRASGLSNRPPLKDGSGMLFVFPQQNIQPSFWMKDMYFDIDIIWINDGVVSQIHSNVPAPDPGTPQEQLKLYIPDDPIDYVLEMNAGSAEKYEFKVGDSVVIPVL